MVRHITAELPPLENASSEEESPEEREARLFKRLAELEHRNRELQAELEIAQMAADSEVCDRIRSMRHQVVSLSTRLKRLDEERLSPLNSMRIAAMKKVRHAVFLADPVHGNIVDANEAANRLFGECAGATVHNLILDSAEPKTPTREEKSGPWKRPERYGHSLWGQLRENQGLLVSERMRLTSYMRGKFDADVDMQYVLDENEHPWVLIEVADLDARNRDELTGLFKRDVALNVFDRDLGRIPVAVVLIDIDDFKYFNDTFGHGGGDQVLKKVANVIAENVRSSDLACRWYDGDEFLVIVRSGMNGALEFARRIRDGVSALCLSLKHKDTGRNHDVGVGISVGVEVSQPGDDWKTLVERADKNLYHSKNNGKGRISARHEAVVTNP